MANYTSSLTIKLLDELSKPSRILRETMRGIKGDMEGFKNARLGLDRRIKEQSQAWSKVRNEIVASTLTLVAFSWAISKPVKAASDLESKFEDIRQKIDGTKESMGALRDEFYRVAPQVNRKVSEIADGFDNLVGAGLSEKTASGLLLPIGKVSTAYRAEFEDVSKMAVALNQNMKISPEQMLRVFDILAQTGKEGSFELRDMAQEFPSLAAAADVKRINGPKGAADLGAALQIMRRGAGTSSEAATNMGDVLGKMDSNEVVKKFAAMGMSDLRGKLTKLQNAGMSPIEAITRLTMKATKGDNSKIGLLFGDKQARMGVIAMVQHFDDYLKIRANAEKANGVVEADYKSRMETPEAKFDRFWNSLERLTLAFGNSLIPMLTRFADILVPIIDKMAELVTAYPNLTAGVVAVTGAFMALSIAAGLVRGAMILASLGGLKAGSGVLGILSRVLGGGAAVAGGAGAGAAGAAVAGGAAAAGGGGLMAWLGRGLLRVAGPVAVGATVAELLNTFDGAGNLWGATSSVDEWAKRNLGFDPSNVSIPMGSTVEPGLSSTGTRSAIDPADMERSRRATEAWRDDPEGARGRVMMGMSAEARASQAVAAARAQAEAANIPPIPVPRPDVSSMGPAGTEAGQAFMNGMLTGLDQVAARGRALAAELQTAFSFNAKPTISPIVQGSGPALRGIHSDVGVAAGGGGGGSGF